jgi:ribokinase
MSKVAVIGSINVDLVVQSKRKPNKGETIIGESFSTYPGGKGANQAVAAAKMGANTCMFGSVGCDGYGEYMISTLKSQNILTKYIQKVKEKESGLAFINIAEGDNSIIVIPGANKKTTVNYLKKHKEYLLQWDVFLIQLEIPIETVEWAIDYLHKHNKTIILNPAPAKELSRDIIEKATYITPNEHECRIVFNSESKTEDIMKQYPNKLIVTEGEKGVRFFDGSKIVHVPSIKVQVVDTTGAGDTFNGAFAVAIAEGKTLVEAIQIANIAAGLSVTKIGAQEGMVNRTEVQEFLDKWGK